METQSERKVKRLRTDNGLEFCNLQFDSFCRENGIVRHRTCTYTPQQNGIAERLNRTIMNKVRSMLSESDLELKFWAEAAATSVYLINRSPSSALDFKVPEELWTSQVPDLSNLKRFGCLAYVHSVEGKLQPRAKRGVFTGYPEGTKGFKVWLLEDKKMVISRNVVFREEKVYKEVKDETENQSDEASRIVLPGVLEDDDGEVEVSNDEASQSDGQQEASIESGSTVPPMDYQLARDRTRRVIKPPARLLDYECEATDGEDQYACYICLLSEDTAPEPNSYQEAMMDPDSDMWYNAAWEEMTSLEANETWELIDRPKDQKAIGCRWIFKRKAGIAGVEPPRYKGRLVAKGYSQKEGVDYQEIFAPVVKHVSIRYMLSAVAFHNMELQQMDVKTAFLHGNLDEFIVMEQPEGFVDKRFPDKVCRLKKSLYGLKQSPRQWNKRFDDFVRAQGYTRSEYDSCVYFKQSDKGVYVYMLLYVDDILIASTDKAQVQKLKTELGSEFDMKDLGDAKKILGMEITRDREKRELSVSQEGYLWKVLGNFNMDQSKSVATPLGAHFKLHSPTEQEYKDKEGRMKDVPYQSAVGSIMYSMVGTRPDLAHAVGVISRFMSRPLKEHWLAVKWVMRYIKGTVDTKLSFKTKGEFVIRGYCDSDYGGDLDRRKSTTGMVFTAGGNTVSWRSSLQKVVALSSTEAEYIALSEAVKGGVWLKRFAESWGFLKSLLRYIVTRKAQ